MLVELKQTGCDASHMMLEVVALNNGATSSVKVGDSFLVNISEIPIRTKTGRITVLHCDMGSVTFKSPNSNRLLDQAVGSIIVAAKKIRDGSFHPMTTLDKQAVWIKDDQLCSATIRSRSCANCRNKRRVGGEGCAIFGSLPERIVDRGRCVNHVYLDYENNVVEDFWPRSAAVFVNQSGSLIHLVEDESFRYLRKGQTINVTMGGIQLTLVY